VASTFCPWDKTKSIPHCRSLMSSEEPPYSGFASRVTSNQMSGLGSRRPVLCTSILGTNPINSAYSQGS
jgi:hypothetical protein